MFSISATRETGAPDESHHGDSTQLLPLDNRSVEWDRKEKCVFSFLENEISLTTTGKTLPIAYAPKKKEGGQNYGVQQNRYP